MKARLVCLRATFIVCSSITLAQPASALRVFGVDDLFGIKPAKPAG